MAASKDAATLMPPVGLEETWFATAQGLGPVVAVTRVQASQLLLLAILSTASLRGSGDELRAFEVVAISHHPFMQNGAPIQIDGSQFRVFGSGLLELISYAYGVQQYQVSGPEWFMRERYDIWAKLPEGSRKQDLPAMVMTLLVDRFKLKTHWVSRDALAYALSIRRSGLNLKPSQAGESMRLQLSTAGYIYARSATMGDFCGLLARHLHRPVLDRSGIDGRFDITMEIGPDFFAHFRSRASEPIANGKGDVPELASMENLIFAGLRGLGLELRGVRAPVQYLLVDSVEKEFTTN